MARKEDKGSPFRTAEMRARYSEYLEKCGAPTDLLSNPLVEEYKNWLIVEDEFPYDEITDTHHLLVPKRVVVLRKDLNSEENQELQWLLQDVLPGKYEMVIEKLSKVGRSVSTHLHIHLIKKLRRKK